MGQSLFGGVNKANKANKVNKVVLFGSMKTSIKGAPKNAVWRKITAAVMREHVGLRFVHQKARCYLEVAHELSVCVRACVCTVNKALLLCARVRARSFEI